MATSAQMLAAGIALVSDTFVLIYSAMIGSKIFDPLLHWYYSVPYSSAPPLDPGMITWIFPVYYGMLLCIWFALLAMVYLMSINRVEYPYGG